ncbi:hypothetical protein ACFL5Z_20660, partial [Planctomycetota bacterium]
SEGNFYTENLRSSGLVAGGFMGSDTRSFSEVIDADAAALARLDYTKEQLAGRMEEITKRAIAGLGTWVRINESKQVCVQEFKGSLVCPWPHAGRYAKRITTLRNTNTGETIRWSDLNAHLIGRHGFFGGRGSIFRVEPREAVKMISSD